MNPKNYLVCSIAFLWLWSGIQPALFALPQSLDLLAQVGVQAAYRVPLFALSCVLDVFFGLGCATRLRHRAWFWAAQAAVIKRFWDAMAPHSYLFIGHSESLFGMKTKFEFLKTDWACLYQKME